MKSLYRVMGAFIGVVLLLIFFLGSLNGISWTIKCAVPGPRDTPHCRDQSGMALPWQLDAVSIGRNQDPGRQYREAIPEDQEISCSASPHTVKTPGPKRQGRWSPLQIPVMQKEPHRISMADSDLPSSPPEWGPCCNPVSHRRASLFHYCPRSTRCRPT